MDTEEKINIPVHIGIIMDGNGRWAKKRFMPRSFGHKNGMNRMIELAETAFEMGVKYFTVYALSTENLSRPKEELDGLFDLFRKYFTKNIQKLINNGVAFKAIGDITVLPPDIRNLILDAEKRSSVYKDKAMNMALNYGSRAEIVRAVNAAVERGQKVTEESFSSLLYTADQPDPDLIIRTGGEVRLSNFLMWQASYSELYFSDVLFPDFNQKELKKAIADYSRRNRRFGKTQEQIEEEKHLPEGLK